MNTLVRDFAIVALLLVASLTFNVYRALTRRKREAAAAATAAQETERRQAVEHAPIAGLAGFAASQGWRPLQDPGFDPGTADYVRTMLRNLAQVGEASVGDPTYSNLYGGEAGGHRFVIGNAWVKAGAADDRPGSVCSVEIGEVLPPLFVNLRDRAPFVRIFLKEETLESEEFNRRFQVLAMNREYAMDVLSPRVMELLLSRDDWVFFLELSKLVCVCSSGLVSQDDYRDRVAAVAEFVSLIPTFVRQDTGMELPTLPDGTPVDVTDPAGRQKLEAAMEAMTPEERRDFIVKLQAGGARFLAGMFGKDLPENVAEDAARQAAEREEQRHPDPST